MIQNLLARLRGEACADDTAQIPALSAPLAVIGDVHGRCDLLEQMLAQLADHPQAARMRLVLVGDLIDRGPDSAQVLARAHALTQTPDPFAQVICLMGNHEWMLLETLANPRSAGPRWLAVGGAESVESFGLTLPHARTGSGASDPLTQMAQALADQLGPLQAWLAGLPLSWHEEGVFIAHAGADARRPLEAQRPETLLWGARARLRPHPEAIVIHGHVICSDAYWHAGHINVDTGAWCSDRLSAVVLGVVDEPVFVQARLAI